MITPESFKKYTAELSDIIEQQLYISHTVGMDEKSQQTLLKDANNLKNANLRVLVMGQFSSGKSTFLNALMGNLLLPTKAIPTTATIGEITYAETPSATLYPKNKRQSPFPIKLEDMAKYIVIDHSESDRDEVKTENPYEKILIKYPLPICKMGIDLIDSPGTNDPTCHDRVTQDYLPNADAIIYIMNSAQAFDSGDKAEIERLVALGYKSIIFVLNYFDVIEANDDNLGTNEAVTTRKHYTQVLSPYTTLGEDGIHFISSLLALAGKRTNNNAKLIASHFVPFEKKLEQILFNERGRLKLVKALYSTKKINKDISRLVSDSIELGRADQAKLAVQLQNAQNNLNQAKRKAELISQQFSMGISDIVNGAKDKARSYYITNILPNIGKWVEECKPKESVSILHPKRTGTAYADCCIKHLQGKVETAFGKWCEEELVPQYLLPKIKSLAERQGSNMENYEIDLHNVRSTLSLSLSAKEEQGKANAGTMNRVLAAMTGALLGDIGSAVSGAQFGFQGLGRTLATMIVAGVVLGIMGIFSFPAMLVASIISSLLGMGLSGFKVENKIKQNVAQKAKEELSKKQEGIVAQIGDTVQGVLNKATKALSDTLKEPIVQYQKLFDEVKENQHSQGQNLLNKIQKYTELQKKNSVLADKLDDFAQIINT